MKRCQRPETKLPAHGCDCSGRSGNWRRRPFTDPYLRLIAAVEIQTAAATMVVPSTVHIYISVTEEQLEKLPLTMFRRLQRLRSARESTLGLNFRIVCANLPP